MTKDFYSTIEAAKIFGVSRIRVFQWIKEGKIQATKVGRNFVIPYSSIVEKIGKTLGAEKKAEIEKTIEKATKQYEQTFKMLGKE